MIDMESNIRTQLNSARNLNELNDLKVKYLGKKGIITELASKIKEVPNEEKKEYGMKVNEVRNLFNEFYETKKAEYEEALLNEKAEKGTKNKKILIMAIKPLADRVLIEPAAAEEKTIGGIIIPDTAKEKPLQGKVVATGNGTKDEEMVVKEGDTVLYGKYAGTELEYDGVKYLIMRQSDILAILG